LIWPDFCIFNLVWLAVTVLMIGRAGSTTGV
jgi:hypothetical protein